MTDDLPQRREQDMHPPSLDIQQMIIAESDPRQRASLIVLHAISLALEANTATVRDISSKLEKHLVKFDNHATTEQELLSQGKGAWRVMAWVIGVAQVVALYAWNDVRTAWKEVRTEVTAVVLEQQVFRGTQAEIKSRIGMLEQAK